MKASERGSNLTPGREPSGRVSIRPSASFEPRHLPLVLKHAMPTRSGQQNARHTGCMLIEAATLREAARLTRDGRLQALLDTLGTGDAGAVLELLGVEGRRDAE